MLPKAKRIPKKAFPKGGILRRFPFGSLRLSSGAPRAAVVVSKKTLAKATVRNALRRKIYAALSDIERNGGLRGAVVVFPNQAAGSATYAALTRALATALK
jgi:ribonuclease P protein component